MVEHVVATAEVPTGDVDPAPGSQLDPLPARGRIDRGRTDVEQRPLERDHVSQQRRTPVRVGFPN